MHGAQWSVPFPAFSYEAGSSSLKIPKRIRTVAVVELNCETPTAHFRLGTSPPSCRLSIRGATLRYTNDELINFSTPPRRTAATFACISYLLPRI
ncbi:hypothetical protein U1Q18_051560 [Sarracenia purpurea var. burkii]